MNLDPELGAVLDALETHGVTCAHLRMLLRLLQVQRNGSWLWRYVNGQLTQCDAQLVFPSREFEVARVCEVLLEGSGLRR